MRATPRVLGAVVLAVVFGATACSASASNPSGGGQASPRRGPVTGTVTVKDGNKIVCVMTVKNGKGTCKVSTAHYAPGTLRFDASYSGGPGYKPSHGSASVKLLKP